MQDPAATLKPSGQSSDKPTAAAETPGSPKGLAMKFSYPSGSRPLDGYTIKRGVGTGGFGEVYFATSDAGKELALKRIQRNLDIEVRGVTQCLNLKHTNLISLYDIKYDDEGEGWIVMEYVSGESLRDVIERNPNGMPLDQVNAWFKAIAEGVIYLHTHGIVHRDLKPGNIFDDEGLVKIGDYGLSKFISCSRRSGQTESVGTFHYMAPEIGKGVYGKEIDIYALGVILYEMLTGNVPFEGESSQEIMMKHLTANPDLAGIADPYRDVIHRAMLKDATKRFTDVDEMLGQMNLAELSSAQAMKSSFCEEVVEAEAVSITNSEIAHLDQADGLDEVSINQGTPSEIIFGPLQDVPVNDRTFHSVSAHSTISKASIYKTPSSQVSQESWASRAPWWQRQRLDMPLAKWALFFGFMFLLLINSAWLIPAVVVFGVCYLMFSAIRLLLFSGYRGAPSADPAVATVGSRPRSADTTLTSWQVYARGTLQAKASGDRLVELISSLLIALAVAAVLSLVMLMIAGPAFESSIDSWARFTWLTMAGVFGAWNVLAVGKRWETSDGEAIMRRFAMLVIGLLVGAAVSGTNDYLAIDLGQDGTTSPAMFQDFYPTHMVSAQGNPKLSAYMIFFAILFGCVRWWKQVDPLRKTRFSLWATLVSVLWSVVLPLPQPWGMMIAATISVSVQMAAPWMPHKNREVFYAQSEVA